MTGEGALVAILASGLAACQAVAAELGTAGLALIGTLFLTGLIGGATHCTGMCGPFVLGQAASRLAAVPAARMGEFHRFAGAALLPYHLGRATTYVVLGMVAAAALGRTGGVIGADWLGAAALLAAALVIALAAASRLGIALRIRQRSMVGPAAVIARLARPFANSPLGWRGYALGLALGFIPCGLVYAALLAVASTGEFGLAALGMLAFALGTMPALVAIGWSGLLMPPAWRPGIARATPALLLANSAMLAWLAWQTVST
ncbi:MAG: sulfite exporter TauE/SafE family protein [Alphaproteobacteria bacterium]|nr:sulfite exporter TauE/SafE family protein [Alphaproteobacteria bacterium]